MSRESQGAFALPLYDPIREWLQELPVAVPPDAEKLNSLCTSPPLSGGGVPIRFTRASAARARTYAEQFEVRTYLHGEIPMRETNWHDVFNALAWLAFPHTKAAINRRHVDELENERRESGCHADDMYSPGATRSATRDALTLFDESGIIVASTSVELLGLIRSRQWKSLFWEHRSEVLRAMRFFVIGHALHEKALHAYKGMTAKALLFGVSAAFLDLPAESQRSHVDRQTAEYICMPASLQAARELPPLPITGIPGWGDNDHPAYYDDGAVFRQSTAVS